MLDIQGQARRNNESTINRPKLGQRHGIDCVGTFAPACWISSQRVLRCLAALRGCHVRHLDVRTAYLHVRMKEDGYVKQAPEFEQATPTTGGA